MFCMRRNKFLSRGNMVTRIRKNKLNEKRSLIPRGIRLPI